MTGEVGAGRRWYVGVLTVRMRRCQHEGETRELQGRTTGRRRQEELEKGNRKSEARRQEEQRKCQQKKALKGKSSKERSDT